MLEENDALDKNYIEELFVNSENEKWTEAIQNHYTNLGISDLSITTYKEPFYFGNFKNLDGSINSAYLVLKNGISTYVILSEKTSLEGNSKDYEIKAEITKVEDIEDMDEFVYMTLQDSDKNLKEKVGIIMSYSFIRLIRKL